MVRITTTSFGGVKIGPRAAMRNPLSALLIAAVSFGSARTAAAQCLDPAEIETIISGDPDTGDVFGTAVAVLGNTIAVGAPGDDAGGSNRGAVYIFNRTGDSWVQQQKILPSDGGAGQAFGTSVAILGSTLLVGAPGTAGGGAAYVFDLAGGTWTQTIKLTSSDRAAGDDLGRSVGLSSTTNRLIALLGAPLEDNTGPTGTTGGTDTGSVYVFTLNTLTVGSVWTERQKIMPTDGGGGDRFGLALALAGTRAIIGAPWDDNIRGVDAGSAYSFTGDFTASTWTQEAKLLADGSGVAAGGPGDEFGSAVALSGTTAAIGAPAWEPGVPYPNCGVVYVFERAGSAWTGAQFLEDRVNFSGDRFGSAVALSGSRMLVSAPESGSSHKLIEKRDGAWVFANFIPGSFGFRTDSVAFGATIAVFGAPTNPAAGLVDSGSVRVYDLVPRDFLQFTEHPQDAKALGGGSASFSAALAANDNPLVFTYWQYESPPGSGVWAYALDGAGPLGAVSGFTTPTLSITGLTGAAFTRYRCWAVGSCIGILNYSDQARLDCLADFNLSGQGTVQDIYDFLAAWNAGLPAADFNGVGGITVQDIYDFLAAWNTGCG